jgi:hypothetical protein
MSNIIKEIEQSLNEVPPLKIDIKPVMQTAPAPDPLRGVKPVTLPEAVPQPLQAPQPSAPVQAIPSTGSPVPEVPQVDALSYGDTISRMSAQSAADIQKTIAASGAPKPNDVQSNLLNPNTPVQIDPRLSSQANPFAGNKTENAQERLAFEPPVLANGLGNPFSDPNARAAVAAGISKEEYIAYIRDVKAKGEETTFGVPLQPNNLPMEVLQQQQLANSWQGLNAEQIRKKMAEKSGYLSMRRNFNTSFLPFAGSENRSELDTLFAALSFPANLVKGIGLDATRGIAAVSSGTKISNFGGSYVLLPNLEQIARDYEAMRPTRGGTFTGAAILGEQFNSMAVVDQKGAPFNPLAVVRDDRSLWQAVLGFGLDVLADPLNNDKVAETLFKPLGLFQKAKVPDVPAPAAVISREIIPVITEKYRQSPRLVTTVGDTPPVRPQPDRVPTPNTPPPRIGAPASVVQEPNRLIEPPKEIVIEREVARTNELAVYRPTERVFPEAREPYTPIPDSRAIVPVPEVNMYNNVTALFNDSKELPVVQRFMRDVVEQKPFEQIPDSRAIVALNNPVLNEVVEFARTGDLTPNVAVLQGATVDEIADVVADRLELVRDTPMVVPKLVAQSIEVPKLDYSITTQLPRIEPIKFADKPLSPAPRIDLEMIIPPKVNTSLDGARIEALAQEIAANADVVRPIVLEKVSPVQYKLLSGELEYAAAKRAEEINPNVSVSSFVVEKGTALYDNVMAQNKAYRELSKLTEQGTLARTATDTPTYLGSKSEAALGSAGGKHTIEIDNIVTMRGGNYNAGAVNRLADEMLKTGGNIRPIVVRRVNPVEFELVRGNLEYLAAKRAQEINPQFTGVKAFIAEPKNIDSVLRQLDILDEGIPVPTNKPVVVSEAPFTSLSDLIDDARDGSIQSLSEVRNWSQKGDFNTKLKDIPNAVDDLGIDALNTPSLMKVVKGRAGKLSDKVVKEVADSLNKVDVNKAEDVSKSLFDALWRKSTNGQKQTILSSIPSKRLNELGLERVETKVIPPTLPTLSHVRADVIDEGVTSGYHVVNDSQASIESLRVAALREQGLSAREASSMKVHPISEEIAATGFVSDVPLESLLKTRELSVSSIAERNWSSKMLQQVWDIATPQQKARIMSDIDARTLEQLGLERIARSNVIDDHLPPETLFDIPC